MLVDYRERQLSLFLRVARKSIVMEERAGLPVGGTGNGDQVMLSQLLKLMNGKRVYGAKNKPVSALVWDSRQVVRGSVFFAIKGEQTDGNDFIPDAIQRGAIAVVSEKSLKSRPDVMHIQVNDVRVALANCSRRFYDAPDEKLNLVGVTGTNGKTTVSRLIKYFLDQDNDRCGLIGTIDYIVGKRVLPSHKTTPEVDEVCALLAEMEASQCNAAAMEVSSHGIDQNRIYGLNFDTIAFLNLSQDHLDYHGDMKAYFNVKSRIFNGTTNPQPKCAVVNVDDIYGQKLIEDIESSVDIISFSSKGLDANFSAHNVAVSATGTSFELHSPEGEFVVSSPLLGTFNVSNLLAAYGCAYASGVPVKTMVGKTKKLPSVPGRLEVIDEGQNFLTVVDYAHTHDALENILHTVRSLSNGKLVVVFGCGGDRDREKRPLMMQAVCRYADRVIATSDNPRTEAQKTIFDDMIGGMDGNTRVQFIDDREEAIHAAIGEADSGDAIVIAGKGHEAFQVIDNSMIPFDDRLVARAAIRNLSNDQSQLIGGN